MAVDTYIAYVVYPSVEDAESDYQLVRIYIPRPACSMLRRCGDREADNGKVHITKKHETPTRPVARWAEVLAWLLDLLLRCFQARRLGVACSRLRRPVGPRSVR
jgi:hypothetical protein